MDSSQEPLVQQKDIQEPEDDIPATRYPYAAIALILIVTALQSYSASALQAVLDEYLSDWLNISSKATQIIVPLYIVVFNICALPGGFLADRKIGNFATQRIANVFWFVGAIFVLISTIPEIVEHLSPGGENNSPVNLAFAGFGLICFAIGYGVINAIQSVQVGDQFTDSQATMLAKSFSWYYFFCNVGSLGGESLGPILHSEVSYPVCLITICGSAIAGGIIFLLGSPWYRKIPPKLTQSKVSWRQTKADLWTLTPIVKVFAPLIVFWGLFYQQNSTWVDQAEDMNRKLGDFTLPADMMASFNDMLCLALIPLLDTLIFPCMEWLFKLKIRPLHKIGAGMAFASMAFAMAGVVEILKDNAAPEELPIAWQSIQFVLISFAEVFIAITGLEFAYSQCEPHLRNMVTGFWYITQALGNVVQIIVASIPISAMAGFFGYAGAMIILLVVFVVLNRNFVYREEANTAETIFVSDEKTPLLQ